MKKKIALLLALVLILTSLFAGCAKEEKTEETPETSTTEPAKEQEATKEKTPAPAEKEEKSVFELTREDLEGRKIVITAGDEQWKPAYQALADKYTEEFGVQIEVVKLPGETAEEVIQAQFATNELSDIVMVSASPSELTWMRADENLLDLSNEPWVEKISDTSSFLYKGKLYGLPLGPADHWGFCVNKSVFEACGLEVPNSKEELVACFEVLKENGYIPFYCGAGDSWMCGNITSSGVYPDTLKDPDLIDKFNTNQMTYSDCESWLAMAQDVYDWSAAGYFGENFMAQTWDGMNQAVANDECGVSLGIISWVTTMENTFGEGTCDDLELIPYYIGNNDTIYTQTIVELYIPNYGENIDVARHFLNWCAQEENLQFFYNEIGAASPFDNIYSDELKPTAQKLMNDLADGKYTTHLSHNSLIQGQDWGTLCSLMQEVYMNEMTPEEMSAEYDSYREAVCIALGMEGF